LAKERKSILKIQHNERAREGLRGRKSRLGNRGLKRGHSAEATENFFKRDKIDKREKKEKKTEPRERLRRKRGMCHGCVSRFISCINNGGGWEG